VRDAFQLRVNAYRVLLTRGRDGAVIFVPTLPELDATAARLQGHGVKVLYAASKLRIPVQVNHRSHGKRIIDSRASRSLLTGAVESLRGSF